VNDFERVHNRARPPDRGRGLPLRARAQVWDPRGPGFSRSGRTTLPCYLQSECLGEALSGA
jgi:hypothetical protein